MITYRRDASSGKYVKSGEFAAAVSEVKIKIDTGTPFGSYTLDQATKIIEEGIAKGQVNKDSYAIVGVPEKELSGAAAAAKAKHAEKVANGEIQPKAPREKKAPKGYQQKELTPEEQARVTVIMQELSMDEAAAKKILRKEQASARLKAARASNTNSSPVGKSKLDHDKIAQMAKNGITVGAIAQALGASYMGIRNSLLSHGVPLPVAEKKVGVKKSGPEVQS